MKTIRSQFGSSNRIDFIPTSYPPHRNDDSCRKHRHMMDYMEAAAASMCIELSPDEVDGFRFAIPAEYQMSF